MTNTIKINTDGTIKENLQDRCGSIIQDASGDWLGGFSKYLSNYSAFMAELWGVLEGMNLAKSLGLRKVEVNIDSTLVVSALKSRKSNNVKSLAIIRRICELMDEFDARGISHPFRETNVCADAIANDLALFKHDCIYRVIFDFLKTLVAADRADLASSGTISL